ncbi:MAG: hypothetical protein AAF799_46180 [Myxococcota bacterium]
MSPRRRRTLDVCLGCSLALFACKPTEDVTPPETTGSGKVDKAPVEIAAVDSPEQMLPPDTVMLVTGSSVNRAAEVFERDRLVSEFRMQYMGISAMLSQTLGRDLLDPSTWHEIGVDADGPLSFALSGVTQPQGMVFATLTDRSKFTSFIREMAGRAEVEIVEEAYGKGAVLRVPGPDDVAIVLRDDFAVIVLGEGHEGVDLPQRLATMDPNVALAAHRNYRKTTGGLQAADLSAYIDIARMVDQGNAQDEARDAEVGHNWAQEELAEAQKSGASAERLAELERRAEEIRADEARWRARAQAERDSLALMVSGVEGVGFTATMKRGGPTFDGRIAAGEEAFVRRLLSNRAGDPVLPNAMSGTPIWCASGVVEGEPAFELLELLAKAEGTDLPSMVEETRRETGIDLVADLKPAMGHEVGFCVVVDGEIDLGAEDPSKQLGVGAYMQVNDAAKAKYLLAKVASARTELAGMMRKDGEGYRVDVPDWRTMHVDAVGDRIVLSSDPKLAERIASGDPGSMPSKIRPAAARGAMGLAGTAATQAFDLSMLSLWLTASRGSFEMSMSMGGLSEEELAAIKHSRKSKKARKELKKVEEEIAAFERKRSQAEAEYILSLFDPIGMGVMAAVEDERGFTVVGGQFLRVKGMGTVIESLLRGALERGGPRLSDAEQEAMNDMWERQSKAQEAYRLAREEDVARSKKGR